MYTKAKTFFKGLIGTKAFYAAVISLIVPMMVQQGITSFVNLLDNVMVGRLGGEEMTSVAIVNQLIFIFNLTIFGGVGGASIFGAQFYGKNDIEGLRNTFRYKIWLAVMVILLGLFVFIIWGEPLIALFLNEYEGDNSDLAKTMTLAKEYLWISLWGIIPFAIVQCFTSTLKDTGESFVPMVGSVIAILTNLVLNYILIFGHFGFPRLGVAGAAIATVIARYIELMFIVIRVYQKQEKFTFIKGVFRNLRVPRVLIGRITRTGMPLLINELLWAVGSTLIVQCYSLRGLSAVAAVNINNTVWNLFSIIMMALGNAIGIMVGQQLGANEIDKAKSTANKLLFFLVVTNLGTGLLIVATSSLIPMIYNVDSAIRTMASHLLIIAGISMPIDAYVHGTYFTIRSGGKTVITFLFDCVFTLVIVYPIALVTSRFTSFSLEGIFVCVHAANIIKVIMGALMLKSGKWANNVVNDTAEPIEQTV